MRILIPMAGVGERFSKMGFQIPKPLIEIEGKPMIQHVIEMFGRECKYCFIVNSGHVKDFHIDYILREIVPDSTIVPVEYEPLGPAWGVKCAIDGYHELFSSRESVIVSYCDYSLVWGWKRFNALRHEVSPDGIVITYTGFHPHLLDKSKKYASLLADSSGLVTDIREKYCFTDNPMDCHQSAGMYYFRNGYLLRKYVNDLIESGEKVNGEYYVSQVCQLMLKAGLRVANFSVPFFLQWGTPEDLFSYLYWSKYFLRKPCV